MRNVSSVHRLWSQEKGLAMIWPMCSENPMQVANQEDLPGRLIILVYKQPPDKTISEDMVWMHCCAASPVS